MSLVQTLSRYSQPQRSSADDRCALCARPLGPRHRHVVHLERRTLSCACGPCALLFIEPSSASAFRTVPERVLVEPGRLVDDETWAALQIPVRLAFVFFNSRRRRWVALYPSPAGAVESELPLGGLQSLRDRSALLSELQPDVEALLVHGGPAAACLEALLVPIDTCYELVAFVRRHWKGFDGGDARRLILGFIEDLTARGTPFPGADEVVA